MIRSSSLVVTAFALSGAASAHHGFGTFDPTRDIQITGTITGLDYVNPHSWLYLDVPGEDGTVTAYRCEMRPATLLRRSGWTQDIFVVGETITVQGSPDREDPNACYVATLIFADGTTLDRYEQRTTASRPARTGQERLPRLPNGDPDISGDWAQEQYVFTDPRGQRGAFVPLSVARETSPGGLPEDRFPFPGSAEVGFLRTLRTGLRVILGANVALGAWTAAAVDLTPRGEEAVRAVRELYPPDWVCKTTSILGGWVGEGLINRITQSEDVITLEYGHPGVRTIHMNMSAHPRDVDRSRVGHSIGRWEDDVLIVDTVGFSPGLLWMPLSHGEQLHVVERFSLDPERMALTREYVATDPEYFNDEYSGSDVLYPSEVPFTVDTCEDLTPVNSWTPP